MRVDESCAIVGENALGDAKLVHDVIPNEIVSSSSTGLAKSYYVNPLDTTLCNSNDPYITSR